LQTGARRRGRARRPELQLVGGRGRRPRRAVARREGLTARNGDVWPSSCPSPGEVGVQATPSCSSSVGRACGRGEMLLVAIAGSSCSPSSSSPSRSSPASRARIRAARSSPAWHNGQSFPAKLGRRSESSGGARRCGSRSIRGPVRLRWHRRRRRNSSPSWATSITMDCLPPVQAHRCVRAPAELAGAARRGIYMIASEVHRIGGWP
jgi:hypothetical protein